MCYQNGYMKKTLQIFKPGKHVSNTGTTLEFTEADLQASAAAYNPAIFQAAIVIGHPKTEDPRWGGIDSLIYSEGHVEATPIDVQPEFAEMVNKKLFNAVSASWYTPDSPNNPVPGVYYLRHVGFLGAQPPAIKGLNPSGISFSEAEPGIVEFAELQFSGYDDMTIAKLFRRIREYFIAEKGIEIADNMIPDFYISDLEIAANRQINKENPPLSNFNEGDVMSAEDKQRLAALEAENQTLKQQQADFAEAQEKTRRDAAHADNVAFAEGLVKSGQLLPSQKDAVIANLNHVSDQANAVEFGEGEAKQPLLEALKASYSANPKIVNFGEHESGGEVPTAKFNGPAGVAVDQTNLELHNKAVAFSEANNVSYEVALSKVQ